MNTKIGSTKTTGTEDQNPKGFIGLSGNAGLKEQGHDCLLIASTVPTKSAAMLTQSLFAGPSVTLCRETLEQQIPFQGLVVISKNANVATGQVGDDDARELQHLASQVLGLSQESVFVASTGVIGKPYDMPTIRNAFEGFQGQAKNVNYEAAAAAIMTTDTCHKVCRVTCGDAVLVGIAKGVGMIEPNMATMLTFFFTDAQIPQDSLNRVFKAVVDKTFNALSVDSDTSTSDSAAIFANGLAGIVDEVEFQQQLELCATSLVKQIAIDGEGATKIIVAQISGARDSDQARRVAKSIINSPLVKTAVHGQDPNWGRVAMAIGKLHDETDIDPSKVVIAFGGYQVYPMRDEATQAKALKDLEGYLAQEEIEIQVSLGVAEGAFTAYGCDLSEGYIRINADYTT